MRFGGSSFSKMMFSRRIIFCDPSLGGGWVQPMILRLQSRVNNDVFSHCTKACKNLCFIAFLKSGLWYVNNCINVKIRGTKCMKACKNEHIWGLMWRFVVNNYIICHLGSQMASSGLRMASSCSQLPAAVPDGLQLPPDGLQLHPAGSRWSPVVSTSSF